MSPHVFLFFITKAASVQICPSSGFYVCLLPFIAFHWCVELHSDRSLVAVAAVGLTP